MAHLRHIFPNSGMLVFLGKASAKRLRACWAVGLAHIDTAEGLWGIYRGYVGAILGSYWGYIGVMLGLYWGYIGILENKMETTIGIEVKGLGFYEEIRPLELTRIGCYEAAVRFLVLTRSSRLQELG